MFESAPDNNDIGNTASDTYLQVESAVNRLKSGERTMLDDHTAIAEQLLARNGSTVEAGLGVYISKRRVAQYSFFHSDFSTEGISINRFMDDEAWTYQIMQTLHTRSGSLIIRTYEWEHFTDGTNKPTFVRIQTVDQNGELALDYTADKIDSGDNLNIRKMLSRIKQMEGLGVYKNNE